MCWTCGLSSRIKAPGLDIKEKPPMKRTKKPSLLILDDSALELTNFFVPLRRMGYLTQGVQTVEDGWRILETHPISMLLVDVHLSQDQDKFEGLDFMAQVKEKYPHIALMAMSTDAKIHVADRAKAAGAWTFIAKPQSVSEEFFVQIRHGFDVGFMALERKNKKALLEKHPEGIILTDALRGRIQLALKNPDAPVIIEGETGTGKEEIVRIIHKSMVSEHEMPLVCINCAHLKGDLVQSTLFGHKKGAFTGAVEASIGAVGKANGGILFLDEFHRLSHEVQEALLRTLQDGTYYRVGDNQQMYSGFRLFIALPKNLDECAMDGTILLDLRFRLYGVDIKIPPLRERLDQMDDFVDLFFAQCDRTFNLTASERTALIARCREFHWQGNIRQLFGILNMLAINAQLEGGTILAVDLPVQRSMLPPEPKPLHGNSNTSDEISDLIQTYSTTPWSYDDFIDKFEKSIISRLLSRYKTVKKLCEAIAMPRSTFEGKKKKLGISLGD